MKPPPLFPHQAETKARLKEQPRFFDMSEPGTGKTRVEVEDFAERRYKGGPPAIVTATRSTLESAWADDFRSFAPGMRLSIAYATNRKEAFTKEADVYITNHDAVNWLVKQDKRKFWKKFEGGTIINDESTAFKHHTSGRSRNLAKIINPFEYRRNLSGLPDPNGLCDLWHQFYLLDGGKRLGTSFFNFRSNVCTPTQVGPDTKMVKWEDKPGVESIIGALIQDISIKHLFEECVGIPKNHAYTRAVNLSTPHHRHYLEMEKHQLTQVKGKTLSAINKGVLRVKLLQIASGAIYNDGDTGGDREYSTFDSNRYEFVTDLAQEARHSVVFFQWKHQREELIKECTKRGISFAVYDGNTSDKERTEITRDFQAGKYDEILAHPKSAAHGLTWTRGTRTIWASPTDNLEWYKQGLKRIHRIGQTEKTETITVVARDTYDEIAWERLTGKSIRADAFADQLRVLI